MKKRTSLIIGIVLLMIAVVFIGIAFTHPEYSFPVSLRVTYMFYGVYLWLMFHFLLEIPVLKRIRNNNMNGSVVRAVVFLLMAIVFFVMEIIGDKVDIYTIIRGFIVIGGIDVCLENIQLLTKQKNTEGGSQ